MSEVKPLLNTLLWQIYGLQESSRHTYYTSGSGNTNRRRRHLIRHRVYNTNDEMALSILGSRRALENLVNLSVRELIDLVAILKVEIRLMGVYLGSVLITRDKLQRNQEILCAFVDAILGIYFDDAHPKMRFSLSPPPPKSVFTVKSPTNIHAQARTRTGGNMNMNDSTAEQDEAASDYNQWLHAMKLVVRLPGGTPPEFRRKLWLSLADKYLKSKNVDWSKEEEKCFCEKWREDDEELGIQIVKDLHRTGSNLCTGPAGNINQAKLKRILLGYARYNPEVGYCQGFNMLGALILQVMDKEEIESMKVMIYLVEGILPPGYFCGSMGGLQADMGVFRELMQTKLPRLAKHLQKLQGPVENAYEPPLTNVFTMQWFLTMFCTCLPMNCVLRVWDLVLIEGSDVLLRTALVLWSLLEERVLNARTADEFYCNMGSYTSELLNGHLIDSNGLIEKIVQLGPIEDLNKLRDKHLYTITPLKGKQGLHLYYDDELETESDEESRLAMATIWGLPWGRRGSLAQTTSSKQTPENKERIALDISLLKKQYDRLRERQKQAHIILTTACTTARQPTTAIASAPSNQSQVPVSQLLMGRSAIVTNKGRRIGPPVGAIPPARKPSLPAVLQTKPPQKQLRRGETLHWRDTDLSRGRRESLTWKEIKADQATMLTQSTSAGTLKSHKIRSRLNRSDSSSYSEEDSHEEEQQEEEEGSSTDTSLCDDDPNSTGDKTQNSSFEQSPKRKSTSGSRKHKDSSSKGPQLLEVRESKTERKRPKSWAPTTQDIPFTLMNTDSPTQSAEPTPNLEVPTAYSELKNEREDSAAECDRVLSNQIGELSWSENNFSTIAGDLGSTKLFAPLHIQTDLMALPSITSTSQLSPMPDISSFLKSSIISPLPTPKPLCLDSTNSLGSGDGDNEPKRFDVSDDGVTNQYFERVNSVERPTKLDLLYSLNDEDSIRNAYNGDSVILDSNKVSHNQDAAEKVFQETYLDGESRENTKVLRFHNDYSDKSTADCVSPHDTIEHNIKKILTKRDENIPGETRDEFRENILSKSLEASEITGKQTLNRLRQKRADPRRLTIARSTTIELEDHLTTNDKKIQQEKKTAELLELRNFKETFSEVCPRKTIPSTADLEERYKNLEKQLSLEKEKERADKARRIEYVTRKLQAPQGSMEQQITRQMSAGAANERIVRKDLHKQMSANAAVQSAHYKLRQMSDAEEQRKTDRLQKQLSASSDASSKSSSMNLGSGKETGKAKEAINGQDSKQQKTEKDETLNAEVTGKSESSEAEKEKPQSEKRENLKKLPSTAELEERFEKMEREQNVAKNRTIKKNKEPPDDETTDLTKAKLNREQSEQNLKEETVEAKASEHKEEKETDGKATRQEQKKKDALKHDEENISKQNKNDKVEGESSTTGESTRKKTPPSTEELEKRFKALERKISGANLRENENKVQANKKTEEPQQAVREEGPTKKVKEKMQKNDPEAKYAENTNTTAKEPKNDTPKPEDGSAQSEKQNPKRRASEPPATEELQKRYDTPKRRMSTRNSSEYESETVEEAMQRIEQTLMEEELIEVEAEKSGAKDSPKPQKEPISFETKETKKIDDKKPPTTEDLESRFEALVNKTNTELSKKSTKQESKEIKDESTEKKQQQSENVKENEILKDKINSTNIPSAPPMPEVSYNNSTSLDNLNDEQTNSQRRALIEELQSKMKTPPNGENIKPSAVNPQRRKIIMRKAKTHDETTEPHAISDALYYRSVNNESLLYYDWQELKKQQEKFMVRRFSDLPSRADLENRLQFLEQKLYRKLTKEATNSTKNTMTPKTITATIETARKQRRASDSEVTSQSSEVPSMSASTIAGQQRRATVDLEERVQALEKQLSENSLKLLEAMRAKADVISTSLDVESPRKMSIETIDATGKELVRYAHTGELDELEGNKPINISINIKMMLNKEQSSSSSSSVEKKRVDSCVPTTEELEKRLELLEQQLKATRDADAEKAAIKRADEELKDDLKSTATSVENKFAKDAANEEVKKGADEGLSPKQLTTDSQEQKERERERENLTPPNKVVESRHVEKPKHDSTTTKEIKNERSSVETLAEVEPLKGKAAVACEIPCEIPKKHAAASEIEAASVENSKEVHNIKESQDKMPEEEPPKTSSKLSTKLIDQKDNKTLANEKVMSDKEKLSAKPQAKESKSTTQEAKEPDSQKLSKADPQTEEKLKDIEALNEEVKSENLIINTSEVGEVDPNKKTLVLLLDNEPKQMKVRRLTRANTEELEGLFQALEKQLSERNLVKSEDGKLMHAETNAAVQQVTKEAKALADLSKEIADFTSETQKEVPTPKSKETKSEAEAEAETFDWGTDTVKHHLKRKTVYLPSTKELEARFRSLERQIHLLEHVEKIDVEQRLLEIERKIKLQYSLSHEKDLNKFLDLCEGKGLDDDETEQPNVAENTDASRRSRSPKQSPARTPKSKSPYTSPARDAVNRAKTPPPTAMRAKTPPPQSASSPKCRSPYTSPARSKSRESRSSPIPAEYDENGIPTTADLEYRYRALELKPSKSKENLNEKIKRKMQDPKKQPIHPLEMLLDSSPDESAIPTTGELEHRLRMLEEHKRQTPSPTLRSRSHSPSRLRASSPTAQEQRKTYHSGNRNKNLACYVDKPEPPTEDELEARMRALEQDRCFDRKTQRNFEQFNKKLKDAISPSQSFDDYKVGKSREQSPRSAEPKATTPKSPKSPKSVLRDVDAAERRYNEGTASKSTTQLRSTSPKVIRFRDEDEIDAADEYRRTNRTRAEQHQLQHYDSERMVGNSIGVLELIEENNKMLQRILKQTLTDSRSRSSSRSRLMTASTEGLDEMGSRLMRETSPLTRTGTHTGVPLRTDDNINERLTSIKNTIKSIDTLCEEKPYHKEKCQRYIDSLCNESVYFGSKKPSLEDLTRSESRSNRLYQDYAPSIRVSDHSLRPSEYYRGRSIGSAESIRSTSPLRAASPVHHRSTRDLRREVSPRRRRDEEREEYESSRVRRDYMLPNYYHDNYNSLRSSHYDSLTKFHKVDRQLDTKYKYAEGYDKTYEYTRSASRSPLRSPYGSREDILTASTQHNNNSTQTNTTTTTTSNSNKQLFNERSTISPYRQQSTQNYDYNKQQRSQTPVYAPGKLEIRHTTVTSTFYDRMLVEKQLERQLSRPPSRSPLVSPSVAAKSYLGDSAAGAANAGTEHLYRHITTSTTTTTTTTAASHSSIVGTSVISIAITALSNSTPVYTSSTYNASSTIGLIPHTSSYAATSTASTMANASGNPKTGIQNTSTSSTTERLISGDLNDALSITSRIRNCENMLAQFSTSRATSSVSDTIATTSIYTGTSANTNSTGSSSTLSVSPTHFKSHNIPLNIAATTTAFSASFLPNLSYAASTSTASSHSYLPTAVTAAAGTSASLNTSTTSIYTAGVYNPLMSHTMRQNDQSSGHKSAY